MLKNENGITLVALVVTVVILIILATISISIVIQGGLIQKTEDAKELYENVSEKFDEQEANVVAYLQPYLDNATKATN